MPARTERAIRADTMVFMTFSRHCRQHHCCLSLGRSPSLAGAAVFWRTVSEIFERARPPDRGRVDRTPSEHRAPWPALGVHPLATTLKLELRAELELGTSSVAFEETAGHPPRWPESRGSLAGRRSLSAHGRMGAAQSPALLPSHFYRRPRFAPRRRTSTTPALRLQVLGESLRALAGE
jgi:hypothetical protein